MDLPSIKLNLFKKVEYYLILSELDSQFYIQLDLLTKLPEGDRKNYPSWGVEKKILFWSYIYHKYWGDIVRPDHLNVEGMFITESERKGSIFHNLEAKGFGKRQEDGIVLNGRGRDFGNLLWYLYDIEEYKPGKTDAYKDVYGADYYLKKNFFGSTVLTMQLAALVLLMLFGASFVILEILDSVNLLDNLTTLFKIKYLYFPKLYITFLTLPVLLLTLSIGIHLAYKKVLNNKYKRLEEKRGKSKNERCYL